MKKKVVLLPAVLLALLAAAFFAYAGAYYHATAAATAALSGSGTVEVRRTDYGWFFDGPSGDSALIFYPGAKVEETAYAPLALRFAEEGMDVCLVKMPFRLAFFGVGRAETILEGLPHEKRYIGGHSLGGAMAAIYAAEHPEGLSGVLLLAAYPTKPLDGALSVLTLYGSGDGVLNRESLEKGRAYLSATARELVIEGGNHAQFGDYGEQKGDGEASITPEEQREQTVRAALEYLRG